MTRIATLVLAAAIGNFSIAAAELPTRAQFALQLALDVPPGNGVIPLTLPLSVYQQSRSAELADLRVFNGQGQPVPFAWVDWTPQETVAAVSSPHSDALLFPLHDVGASIAAPSELPLRVEFASGGTLRRVELGPAAAPTAAGAELQALVLDLVPPSPTARLQSLRFMLPEGAGADYRALLAIDRSEDLRWWTPVAQAPLTWLRDSAGASLVQDVAVLPASSGRYARLRWLEGTPLAFARVEVRWQPEVVRDPVPPQLVQRFEGTAGQQAGDWIYVVPQALVAQQLGLDLPEANTVLPVAVGRYLPGVPGSSGGRIGSGSAPGFQAWLRSTFYRLDYQGSERRSGLLQIAPLAQPQWVLRAETANPPARAPVLELRWTPRTLLFNARGGGPYVLAVGAAPAALRTWSDGPLPLAQIAPGFRLEELQTLVPARVGIVLPALAAPAAAVAEAAAEDDAATAALRRKWLLWSVLGGGVALLAALSWRLYRQTQGPAPTDPPA